MLQLGRGRLRGANANNYLGTCANRERSVVKRVLGGDKPAPHTTPLRLADCDGTRGAEMPLSSLRPEDENALPHALLSSLGASAPTMLS